MMSQHPLGSSQDEEHSLASIAYLPGSFPMVITVVLMQGQGQHFPGLQPLMVARGLWPALCPAPLGLVCRDQAEWAVECPHVGGASFTPVEQLLVFSAQPICVGSPHDAHGWWFQVTPALLRPAVSVLVLQSLSCSPSCPAVPTALLCQGLCCLLLPWAQEPSLGSICSFMAQ